MPTGGDIQKCRMQSEIWRSLFELDLCYIMFFLGFLEIVPKRTKDSWFSYITVYLNRYVQVHNQLNSSLPFAQRNSRD